MTAEQQPRAGNGTTENATGRLEPFAGWFVPGLCFESGHSIWLYDFAATPTSIGGYSEVWVVHPDDERVLYVDPEAAGATVSSYHHFDRVVGADTAWRWTDENLELEVVGDDGTLLDVRVELTETPVTRLLAFADRALPDVVSRTVGPAVRDLGLNGLLRLGGIQTAGRTETGRRYRGEAGRILLGTVAEATLDGENLGRLVVPTRPVAFGDVRATRRPTFFSGRLWLERRETDEDESNAASGSQPPQ